MYCEFTSWWLVDSVNFISIASYINMHMFIYAIFTVICRGHLGNNHLLYITSKTIFGISFKISCYFWRINLMIMVIT